MKEISSKDADSEEELFSEVHFPRKKLGMKTALRAATGLTVVRGPPRLCKPSTTLFISGLVAFSFFFLVSLISENHLSSTNQLYIRSHELPTWGFNQSLTLVEYLDPYSVSSFILQPQGSFNWDTNETSLFCGPEVRVLFLVASTPNNSNARRAIRSTWGSKENLGERGMKLIFVLGRANNTKIEDQVAAESDTFGDILVEDFIDTYHNLTLKSMAMLKWVNLTCFSNSRTDPSIAFPQYVLKTDEDMFFNVERLNKVLSDSPSAKLIGRLICGAKPFVDPTHKFYMPKYIFPDKIYPGYLSGTGYVLKGDIIPQLLANALTTPLLHLEDIYVTGLLAGKSKYIRTDSSFFTYLHIPKNDFCGLKYMVNSHNVTPWEMRYLWENKERVVNANCNLKKNKWVRRVPRLSKRIKMLCLF